ncbi:hypothetical protein BD413DRAFT_561340 [Trametes elegans]|nr:hypothetical protein BD413DRAFT_561340 [Trametes elegans]
MAGLVKAGLLAICMGAMHVAVNAPNPPPKDQDTSKYHGGDLAGALSTLRVNYYLLLAIPWSVAANEIVALLARDLRPSYADAILSKLFKTPAAVANLQLNAPFLAGFALLVSGAALRAYCYKTMGRHFTFQLTILKEHKLVTSGPYSVVRHPSYTGIALCTSGQLLVQLSAGSWVAESGILETTGGKVVLGLWTLVNVYFTFMGVRRVPKEDAVLREEFGEQWDRWAKKTPYALIPYVY